MNAQRPRYLFAKWKMFLDFEKSLALARSLAALTTEWPATVELAVFPSALALAAVAKELAGTAIAVGAQNVYWVPAGGYTGEVSAEMYAGAGARYALIGHSERRHQFKETNHEVRQKVEAALAAGLTPVLCVGETERERKNGETNEVVEAQVRAAYSDLVWPSERPLIVAYEPVWAIGTGETATPVDAEKMAAVLVKLIEALVPGQTAAVLYGGSVRVENVAAFLAEPHVSGVLVGGASAQKESWQAIVRAARAVQ